MGLNRTGSVNGYGEKLSVKIITVDKEKRRVECATRDGAMIWAAVWETGTVFQWPEVGQTWTVRKDTNVWRLDQQVHTVLGEEESEAVPKTLAELPEGDTRVNGETVHVNNLSGKESTFGAVTAESVTATAIAATNMEVTSVLAFTPGAVIAGPDFSWRTPSMFGTWANYETNGAFDMAGYRKNADGQVFIKGLIKAGAFGSPSPIFTLPSGYRPLRNLIFDSRITYNNGTSVVLGIGRIDVASSGEVLLSEVSGSQVLWLSITHTFYADGS